MPHDPQPLTDEQLAEYEQLIARTTPVGAATAAPGMAKVMAAEIRRLRAELADFSGRVNELESKLCDCEPVREHGDYKHPAFYQHESHCRVTELTQSAAVEAHVVADASNDPEHTRRP